MEPRVQPSDDADDRQEVRQLFANLPASLPTLETLLRDCQSHWGYEDPVYRFYHHSFKVYAQALAFFSLRVNYTVETIAMVFFGLNTLVTGYLVFRSTFLPRALGVLSAVGGLGWLIYLYEPLARRLESYIVGVGLIGAVVTVLWFLVKGVNEQRWQEQANAATASIWR